MQYGSASKHIVSAAAFFVAALALVAAAAPAAFADAGADAQTAPEFNRAEVYLEASESDADNGELALLAGLTPLYGLSEEIRYFAREESNANYDQGFSSGGDYHALGYYQFDHRYGLQSFLIACYNYNPETYSMFAQFKGVSEEDFEYYDASTTESAIRCYDKKTKKWGYTDLGNALNEAWHAAYAANPAEFAALQDAWSYNQYYLPARSFLKAQGISIDERADCVKGLCWSMCNLFGSGGWRKYVTGSGINSSMTDKQFVTTLCDYLVGRVGDDYSWGSYYEKRYTREKETCLEYLANASAGSGYASDIKKGAWYVGAYEFVVSHGIMRAHVNGVFGPDRALKREEAAQVLYNYLGNDEPVPATDHRDVEQGEWYSAAVNWCVSEGYMNGHKGTDRFGVGEPMTREQIACVMARVANANVAAASSAKFSSLPDCNTVSDYARDCVIWAVDASIIDGKKTTSGTRLLAPQESVTRAQIAAIMMNAVEAGRI